MPEQGDPWNMYSVLNVGSSNPYVQKHQEMESHILPMTTMAKRWVIVKNKRKQASETYTWSEAELGIEQLEQ